MSRYAQPLLHMLTVGIALFSLVGARPAIAATPEAVLQEILDDMFAAAHAGRDRILQQPTHIYELVEQTLIPHVAMERMSRTVLGKNWRKGSADQQTIFVEEFKNRLVLFYTSALLDDPGRIDTILAVPVEELITFRPANIGADDRQALVRAQIQVPNGPQVPVSFRMVREDDKWKLLDVSIEGISLVITWRKNFDSIIRREGFSAMLEQLMEKNRQDLEEAESSNTDKQKGESSSG